MWPRADDFQHSQTIPSITLRPPLSTHAYCLTPPLSTSGSRACTPPAIDVNTTPQALHTQWGRCIRAEPEGHGCGAPWQYPSSLPTPPFTAEVVPEVRRLLSDYSDNSRAFFTSLAKHFDHLSQTPAELEGVFMAMLGHGSYSPRSQLPSRPGWDNSSLERAAGRAIPQQQTLSATDLYSTRSAKYTVSSLLNP